jgi:hypothetical protein
MIVVKIFRYYAIKSQISKLSLLPLNVLFTMALLVLAIWTKSSSLGLDFKANSG